MGKPEVITILIPSEAFRIFPLLLSSDQAGFAAVREEQAQSIGLVHRMEVNAELVETTECCRWTGNTNKKSAGTID